MAEKINVPEIRFTGFVDPWEQRKLGEFGSVAMCKRIYKEQTSEQGDVPFFKIGTFGANPDAFISNELFEDFKCIYPYPTPGTLLISAAGSIGRVVEYQGEKAYFQDSNIVWLEHDHRLNDAFLKPLYSRIEWGLEGSTIKRLYNKDLLSAEVTVPGSREQKGIGQFFAKLDNLITLHQRKYDKLCVLKKSMLDKMFPKGGSLYPEIRFAGFTDPWEQRKLGELFEEHSEKDRDDLPALTIIQGGGTVHRDESKRNLQFDRSSLSNYKVVDTGDFIVHLRSFEGGLEKATCYGLVSPAYHIFRGKNVDSDFYYLYFRSKRFIDVDLKPHVYGIRDGRSIDIEGMKTIFIPWTNLAEQRQIGAFFDRLNSLITLHQRKYDGCTLSPTFFRKVHTMQENITSESLFCDYYAQWVRTYKEGAIRDVTMGKYRLTQSWLSKLIPELRLADMDRTAYQQLINGYAQHHERQTTMDFHHQIKGAILDAVDEGLIPRDPTRKVIIKGKQPRIKKMKYLNQFELHAMLADLDLGDEASWDWLILLIAKTGLRFSEALGLTPDDFDFAHQTLSVSKTWDYKNGGGFVPTKNESSVRKVQLDWQLIMQLSGLLKNLPHDKPIFVHGKVYNSTANDVLARHCKNVDVPVISIHGLRHTHASLLLFAGVSIASVSRRLGHASMTTTQETYLHVIRELENKDVDIVMRALSTLI